MFMFSKVLETAFDLQDLILKLVIAALIFDLLNFRGLSRSILATMSLLFALLTFVPLGTMATSVLENRYHSPSPMPEHVDGIIVLGGAVNLLVTKAHNRTAIGAGAERITAMISLAHRYPNARIVYTGGSGDAFDQNVSEAPLVRSMLVDMGVDVSRILFEGQSRNTRENVLYSQILATPSPTETWVLVTSAAHMPRAMGAFEAEGWKTIPYPVDYRTSFKTDQKPFDVSFHWMQQISLLSYSLHEYSGLVYYRLRHWTRTVFPGEMPSIDPLSQAENNM